MDLNRPSACFALALAYAALAACRGASVGPAPAATPARPASVFADAPVSVEGRPLEVRVLGTGGLTVLFVASIHGDEAAGTPLLHAFLRRLEDNPSWLAGRRAVVVPVANPDGVAHRTRGNAGDVDLNRNFPAKNWRAARAHGHAPLSEPESRFLHLLIETYAPERILSFHQAAELIDYDGPGGALAHRLAAVSPLSVRRMGARPGSLGSWAGVDRGLAIITVELPRSADRLDSEASWERYGGLLVEALRGEGGSLPAEDPERQAEAERAPQREQR